MHNLLAKYNYNTVMLQNCIKISLQSTIYSYTGSQPVKHLGQRKIHPKQVYNEDNLIQNFQ